MPINPAPLSETLQALQQKTFRYFVNKENPATGLIIDKTADDWPASIAATGMALTAYPIAVERGLMEWDVAIERTLRTLRFLWGSEQSDSYQATGYKGFYYHFLDAEAGKRAWECELSTVDTAFLIGGVLAASLYFSGESAQELEIRELADKLYQRVDWDWALNGGETLTHGWRPETGFLPYRWEGYDEALLLYTLALGSPTFPIPESSYAAWLKTYRWESQYGIEYVYAGPLFIHQLPQIWLDCRGIQDAFMREKGIDYFENSRRATLVQQQYAIENPLGFSDYGALCWGLTACDGPGPAVIEVEGIQRTFYDYIARGVPYGPDDGTLAPWAVVASLPFAPEIVLPTIDYLKENLNIEDEPLRYGFKATFNHTYPCHLKCWVSPYNYGIDQGPIVLMIENYATGMIWNLMKRSPAIVNGLRRAGFTGGWLDEVSELS